MPEARSLDAQREQKREERRAFQEYVAKLNSQPLAFYLRELDQRSAAQDERIAVLEAAMTTSKKKSEG